MSRIPFLSIPNDDAHIITTREQELTILSEACDRVQMSLHCAEILSSFELVNLDFLLVASHYNVPISVLLLHDINFFEEINAQDFSRFSSI
jgi:hypothetical protein